MTRIELLIKTFNFYITKRGGEFREWYISNTNDGTGSLVSDHGVDINGDSWLVLDASSLRKAMEIVDHFIQSYGMSGSARNSERAKFVYVYKRESNTTP